MGGPLGFHWVAMSFVQWGFHVVSHGFPMGFPWVSYGLPMGFPWVPMVFPWVSHGFPMGFPMGCPWGSHGVPMGFPMGFPWGSHGVPMVVSIGCSIIEKHSYLRSCKYVKTTCLKTETQSTMENAC